MNFRERAEQLQPTIKEHYRWLHRHPELSFEERETTRYLAEQLTAMGVKVSTFPDYNGCIGHIRGTKPGKTVMLRADIDALPTDEKSGVAFPSENPGIMHACGHDSHAAMLLGAAKLLKEAEPQLCGGVDLLFQSAEEGFTGSYYYVDQGYLDEVDFVYGMHVWPGLPTGAVDISDGPRMASCDNFTIKVHGVSSHGSAPHLGKDAIVCASSIIMNLQTLVSRMNDPLNALVVTIGTVRAGSQFNIITDTAVMEGTVRTFDREIRKQVEPALRAVIEGTAMALGCSAELDFIWLEEAIVNDHPHENQIARTAVEKLFGPDAVKTAPRGLGSEDFGYLALKCPGAFGFLGCYDEDCGAVWSLHSDKFKIDERVLCRGSAVYAQFAFDYLEDAGKERDR